MCVVREQHPLQQGLRRTLAPCNMVLICAVREQHPLQQGLRLTMSSFSNNCTLMSQRTASITTRIKTVNGVDCPSRTVAVREQHPLQQGLRLLYSFQH